MRRMRLVVTLLLTIIVVCWHASALSALGARTHFLPDMSSSPPSDRDDFSVAIICALQSEYNAVSLVFDEFWDDDEDRYGKADGDPNHYTTGRIGKHDVVLALLPQMGKTNAASAAASMCCSYRALKLALLVGICGGVPMGEHGDILLGDVILSESVVQHDFGRHYPHKFERKNTFKDNLGRPNKDIRNLLTLFGTDRGMERLETRTIGCLEQLQAKAASSWRISRGKYEYPGTAHDKLFRPGYRHKHSFSTTCICSSCVQGEDPTCDDAIVASCDELGCDNAQLVDRFRLDVKRQLERDSSPAVQQPAIHIGAIASGDAVIKSAAHRDRIAQHENVIAFEMEGAGVWDEVPSIVVKGVCDYADCHKNKRWQNFAAATAASTAKAILERYTQTDKNDTSRRPEAGSSEIASAQHGQPSTSTWGPVFNGPIKGRNVIAGSSTTGGIVTYNFDS